MKIGFYDAAAFDYHAATPDTRPLGGSQSACCFLARALAARGHEVTLVSRTTEPGSYYGVRCRAMHETSKALRSAEVVIVPSGTWGRRLRWKGIKAPLVWWKHDSPDPGNELVTVDLRFFRGFAFVSEWQAEAYAADYRLPREVVRVFANAIAPAFETAPIIPAWFESGLPPTLVYTSAPNRGLNVLIDAFPTIRSQVPDAALKIFSSFAVYQLKTDRFGWLYEKCRHTEGAGYVGSIPQPTLARELASAAALAYPCTFLETFCISAIEAMAVGADLISSSVGALGSLHREYGHLIDLVPDLDQFRCAFAKEVVDVLLWERSNPIAAGARRQAQIAAYRSQFTWAKRAAEWEEWLSEIKDQPSTSFLGWPISRRELKTYAMLVAPTPRNVLRTARTIYHAVT